MTARAQALIQRWRSGLSRRSLYSQHWDDLARVQLVRRIGFVTDTIPGDRRTDELFDGTPMQSAVSLANTIGGMMRPEGRPHFFIKTVEDEDSATDEAKDWLEDTQKRLRDALNNPKARFRQATGEVDLDLVVLGTGVLFIGEEVGEQNHLVFQSVWLNDAVPVFSETGLVEGMFRSRWFTLRQAMNRFGLDNLSEGTRDKIKDKGGETSDQLDERVQFLFAVVPRKEGRVDALLARNLPIANVVIEVETKHEVTISGFHEMPYIVPRWDTMSGEEYGRSPGMIALPDSNTAQAIGETILIAGQRAADPALLAPSDSFLNAPYTSPGGIAAYEADAVRDMPGGARGSIFPLEPGSNFPISRDIQQDTREQIRIAFLRNLFNLPAPGEATMTATEVVARLEEFIREGGPVFGRLETDYTAPTHERAFHVMLRGGGFKPIPEVLQGRGVRFEYESPTKRIREQAQAVQADAWVSGIVETANGAQRPDVLDNVNLDAWAQFTGQANNLPPILINGDDEIKAIRENRAAAEKAAAELAEAQQISEVARNAAPALKALTDQTVSPQTETG